MISSEEIGDEFHEVFFRSALEAYLKSEVASIRARTTLYEYLLYCSVVNFVGKNTLRKRIVFYALITADVA